MSHQHHGRGHSGATGHLLGHLLRHQQDIGLNEEQVGKLRAVALDADRAAIRASAERQVSERELRAMMWDAKTDMSAIEAKVKEAESREADVRIAGIKAKRDMIAVLTPEQQTKLKGLRDGHRHRDGGTSAAAERSDEIERHDSHQATPAG
jgi:Spy/CpxP family protein refolding chaperone